MNPRLFVALTPPADVLREAERASEYVRAAAPALDARFVGPNLAHLTLAFLGAVPESEEARVARALAAVARLSRPFELVSNGLGAFPSAQRASVLWLGFGGDVDAVATLASTVGDALRAVGHGPDDQRFVPHLTLARVRRLTPADRAALPTALAAYRPPGVRWPVASLALVQSHLGTSGARYRERRSFPLAAPPLPT